MGRLIRSCLLLAVTGLWLSAPLLAYDGELDVTFSYDSEPGDFIGQGGSATWTEADGDWDVRRNFDNGVSLSFDEVPFPGSRWDLDFAAPDDAELTAGSYLDAERFGFQSAGRPGLSVTGEGRGCNTLAGEFLVTDVRFDFYGEPVRLDASFEQHCNGTESDPALTGTIDFAQGVLGAFTPAVGNVLVIADNRMWEYTTGGLLVSEVPIMESSGVVPSGTEYLRDLVIDASGRIHVFNGTFGFDPPLPEDVVLSSFAGGTWQHTTFADWKIANNGSYGRVAAFGDYVFATDGLTGDDGIIRFDAANGYSAERFPGPDISVFDYNSLAAGLDGRLYALVSNESTLDIYFPATMERVGQVELAEDVRDIAVDAAGNIFGASWDNNIYSFDATGAVVDSLNPEGIGNLKDIDLSRSGQIVVTGGFDDVFVVTDTTLASATTYPVPDGVTGPFIAFVQPPPSPLFTGGFESGGTDGWSAVAGEAAGFLEVNGGAADNGSFGLEVTVGASCASPDDQVVTGPSPITGVFEGCNTLFASEGEVVSPGATFQAGTSIALGENFATGPAADLAVILDSALIDGFSFVQDDTPAGETVYRARFGLNLDDTNLADSDAFDLLVGSSANGDDHLRVVIKRNAVLMEDRLMLVAREDSGGLVDTSGFELMLPAGWNQIEIYWRADVAGGQFTVSLNNAAFVGLAGLDNDLARVDRVRLGVVDGSLGSSSGNLDIDDFYSWN